MAKPNDLRSPNYPVVDPGRPALNAMGEAIELNNRHDQWHEEHPMEACNPKDWPGLDAAYADIERGEDMLYFGGAGTFEPGDSLVPRKGK